MQNYEIATTQLLLECVASTIICAYNGPIENNIPFTEMVSRSLWKIGIKNRFISFHHSTVIKIAIPFFDGGYRKWQVFDVDRSNVNGRISRVYIIERIPPSWGIKKGA